MSVRLASIIISIVIIAFSMILCVVVIKKPKTSIIVDILAFIIFVCGGFGFAIWTGSLFYDYVTENYSEITVTGRYEITDVTTSGNYDIPAIGYVSDNNELKYISSNKLRVFYDISEDTNPYIEFLRYDKWFFSWTEIRAHIVK